MKKILLIILCIYMATCSVSMAEGKETRLSPSFPVPEYVNSLLETASAEVGYTEGEHGRSKYGEWAGDPYAQWCAEFLCWCVDQVDLQTGTQLLRNQYPFYSGSNTGRDWFIKKGRYICRWGHIDGWGYQWLKGNDSFITTGTYIPQPGDWVFFTWTSNEDTDHVAMVEYCTVDETNKIWIHVIEGNKPSSVERFAYELTNSRILGFGTVHDAMDITMRFGNEGDKVRQLQEKLLRAGYLDESYVTGRFGNNTLDAVAAFQHQYGLKSNGIANIQTQQKLDELIDYIIDHDPRTWTVIDDDDDD